MGFAVRRSQVENSQNEKFEDFALCNFSALTLLAISPLPRLLKLPARAMSDVDTSLTILTRATLKAIFTSSLVCEGEPGTVPPPASLQTTGM